MKDPRQDPNGSIGTASAASVSSSLLDRLTDRDPEAWKRVVRIYYPLVRTWCQRGGLQPDDAADVTQEVFRALAGNVGRFRRQEAQNSFRGWVYGITQRQLMAHWRKRKNQPTALGGSEAHQWLAEFAAEGSVDAAASSVAAPNDRHDVLRRALLLLRQSVKDPTWQAFWRSAVEGHSPADIAADLGISVNAVYVAKARLLARLREKFGELID